MRVQIEAPVTGLLFHVPKFGHELLAGKGGRFGENKVGFGASPLKLGAQPVPSLRAEKMKPRKIDLQSPQPVNIDISTAPDGVG